ncbi:DUF5644 domain-containing protein [Helicobacter cetorum]|uniref:Uncharacterized protein n=1 Tax=Helicobacter cetorum (strain ATCC BAA-540 / CCUG 52418 / MIT 99-5656) TaxID=1163745 RepID=I0ETD1_HELCM|nr:DUF5644 domain-containing protein [Helicobacter cetorum]AFI06200.1 hypothetical protein HCD_05990 [Helicobacter cetorum MIT 99-5656]
MSVLKLHLKVFRFETNKDYNPAYVSYFLEYQEEQYLLDILKQLKGVSYSENIALKINQIAVFEDAKVSDLVVFFGKEWVLEPLSKRYALKDLIIDEQEVLKNYEDFFKEIPYTTKGEKEELEKFIQINFINPQTNPKYLGDGFFLYVKWLMKRYPSQQNKLLEIISKAESGVMNFLSVANYLYKHDDNIDHEIYELQEMLTNSKIKPWQDFSKNLLSLYQYNPNPIKTPNPPKTCALFNAYAKHLNAQSLLKSSKLYLEKMGQKIVELPFCYDGGYYGKIVNTREFLIACAYNLALAKANGVSLVFCEEDAYLNILHAKEILDNNTELISSINEELKKYKLVYEKGVEAIYLNEWVNEFLAWELKSPFDGFSSVAFSRTQKSDNFFNKIHLKTPMLLEANQNYAPILEINQESALSQCANLRYLGIDLGVDFLITHSLGLFDAFERLGKQASKFYKRDHDSTPTLFLVQVVLMAMGEKNKEALGLDSHHHKVTFI